MLLLCVQSPITTQSTTVLKNLTLEPATWQRYGEGSIIILTRIKLLREIHFPVIINVADFMSSDIRSTVANVEFQTRTDILHVKFVVGVGKKNSERFFKNLVAQVKYFTRKYSLTVKG